MQNLSRAEDRSDVKIEQIMGDEFQNNIGKFFRQNVIYNYLYHYVITLI